MRLSSRRLLALAEQAGCYSSYAVARTISGWPEPVEILAKIHEEIAGDNASKHTAPGETAKFNSFVPPNDRLRIYLESIEAEAEQDEATETFYDDLGFS